MGQTKRNGLIVSTGKPKHFELVASIATVLIKKMGASPLDIYTEHKVGKFRFDLKWNDRLLEIETAVRELRNEKMRFTEKLNKKITFVLPFSMASNKAPFTLPYKRWSHVIDEV